MSEDATQEDGAPTEATRREGPASSRPRMPQERLSRGTLVGRYVVLDVLGEGGMGVVYAAYDPELDRKVAVKLLQSREQELLLREAQALARVTHPNVIGVFDVGTLPGDRVFVAMELVEGETLRAWLRTRKPTWREALPVLRGAGAGLAAAHAAGIVHGDFKPENVLVGKDGRVRVLDFGLARRVDDETSRAHELASDGYVAGTPAYFAPELYDHKVGDARSDQFAFGVALYEAVYGQRPFSKDAPRAMRPPPEGSRVPARIHRVITRALAADPAARFPSMDALLPELAIDPGAGRRRIALAAGAAVIVAGATGALLAQRAPGPRCEGAEQRLAGVWDTPVKARVQAAFAATKRPFAASSYAGLERALDHYAGEWSAAVTEACAATRVRGEQNEQVMSLREACLDQRLAEVRALTGLLASADADLVEKGDKVAYGLEPLEPCANVTALLQPGKRPTEPKDVIATYDRELAEARAQMLAGHWLAAMNAATRATDAAKAVHDDAMVAEPMMVRAVVLESVSNFSDALAVLADATWAAMRGKHDELAAEAALAAAGAASAIEHTGEAKLWVGFARAMAARTGVDHTIEQHMLDTEGFVALQDHDIEGALRKHQQAIAEAELAFGHDSPALWSEEGILAGTLTKIGRFGDAIPHFERALALHEQSVGSEHPEIALMLTNLGVCYREVGQDDKARAAYDRALAIRERVYGKTSPMLLATLNNLADYRRLHGDVAGALQMIERAHTIALTFGKDQPNTQIVETTYAETLVAAGRLADAHRVYDELLALEDKQKSQVLATTLGSRAALAVIEHDWKGATALAGRAVALIETDSGKDSGDLVAPLTALGQARAALGQRDAAREALDRAIAVGEHAGLGGQELAAARQARASLP